MDNIEAVFVEKRNNISVFAIQNTWDEAIAILKREPYSIFLFKGNTYYYQGSHLHRSDGPAVEYRKGKPEYWLNGEQLKQKDFFKISKQDSV